jgi:NAD(P)-dependent dehydrogenase (short-subunit alcohol dehydrogenase family)
MFEVNVTGVFMTAQAVAKEMIRWGNGGSIAMIASMSGTVANRVSFYILTSTPFLVTPCKQNANISFPIQGLICPAYNASKAAVLQLGRNLASEWGSYGIRVNTISPGYIATAMVEALFEKYPERRRDWPTQNMLGKLSVPEEYRGAAVFCISDASSFMTGSDLRIDGGHTAW